MTFTRISIGHSKFPRLGRQQIGVYGYFGESPTYYQTNNGNPIPGTGHGKQEFLPLGAYGHWYVDKFDFYTFYMHGSDNVFLGNSVPSNQPRESSGWCNWRRPGTAGLSRLTTIPIAAMDRSSANTN